MKKLLFFTLIALFSVMLVTGVAATENEAVAQATYGECVASWDISTSGNGSVMASLYPNGENYTLVVSGNGAMVGYSSTNDIPWKNYRSQLTKVVIEDGITSIGRNCFYWHYALEEIVVSPTVKTVCYSAFGSSSLEEISLPGVTTIESDAFIWSTIKRIHLGSDLTSVSGSAFYCCGDILEFTIPEDNQSFKVIDGSLYSKDGATLLKYTTGRDDEVFTVPSHVTTIGSQAFMDSAGIREVVLHDSITEIRGYAFMYSGLERIELPDSLKSIGGDAFYETNISEIYIPKNVTSIGLSAFTQCKKLLNITVDKDNTAFCDIDGNLYNKSKTKLMNYCLAKADTIFVVPKGVTQIDQCAFFHEDDLITVVLPRGLKYIGNQAFSWCDSIKAMFIPDTVTSASYCILRGNKTKTVYLEAESVPSGWNSDWNDSCRVVYGHTHAGTSSYVNNGDTHTFSCTLCYFTETDVHTYEGVVTEPSCTENGYTTYTCVCGDSYIDNIIEGPVHSFGDWEMVDGDYHQRQCPCGAVETAAHVLTREEVIIPATCTESGRVKRGCVCGYEVEKGTEPTGHIYGDWQNLDVTYHERYCQCGAKEKETHTFTNGKCVCGRADYIAKWDVSATDKDRVYAYIYPTYGKSCNGFDESILSPAYELVFRGTGNASLEGYAMDPYVMGAPWNDYIEEICKITYENGVTNVVTDQTNYGLFQEFYMDLVIGDTVTEIPTHTFGQEYRNVYLGKGIERIDEYAFDSVTAFFVDEENPTFKSVDGNIYTKDGKRFFRYANDAEATHFEIPETVESIAEHAFYGASKLESITVPYGITEIETDVFGYCRSLKSITLPETVRSIGDYAFCVCDGMTSISIPSGVTFIGYNAFYCCDELTEIFIPLSVVTIDEGAFKYCDSLTIYCEVSKKPSTWHKNWNPVPCPVVWGDGHLCELGGWVSINDTTHAKMCECGIIGISAPHSFDSGILMKEPTHGENGERLFTCLDCGFERTEVAPKLGHKYVYTSFDEDTHTKSCFCGDSATENHAWSPWKETGDKGISIRRCVCGAKEYLETEKEDDKVNTKPNKDNVHKDKDKDKVKIDVVFDVPTLEMIGVQIIPEILEQLNNMETEIETDLGSVILDAIASSKIAGTEGTVNIAIQDITTDKEAQTGHKVFNITVNDEGGEPILPPSDSENNGTVTLSFKYHKGLTKDQVKIAYRDENGKLEQMEVEHYDPETGEVRFKTSHLSEYIVYTEEVDPQVYLDNIFEFRGYSVNESTGWLCYGFAIDYDAIASYENATGKTLDYGVVFASYELLGGKQPLDEKGSPITLDVGKVIKSSLRDYTYRVYDFVLTDIDKELYDHRFVVSGYAYTGDSVRYYQDIKPSDTVVGVSYNKALSEMMHAD